MSETLICVLVKRAFRACSSVFDTCTSGQELPEMELEFVLSRPTRHVFRPFARHVGKLIATMEFLLRRTESLHRGSRVWLSSRDLAVLSLPSWRYALAEATVVSTPPYVKCAFLFCDSVTRILIDRSAWLVEPFSVHTATRPRAPLTTLLP